MKRHLVSRSLLSIGVPDITFVVVDENCLQMREYHAGQVAWAVAARLSTSQYTPLRAVLQAGDLLALRTNEFISHLEKTLGLVLGRKTLGLRKKGV